MNELIDYVFPYVDCNDKHWQKLYEKNIKYNLLNDSRLNTVARYRSNQQMLRYKFRTIEKYMSWINNVYIIVQSESQIPNWLNRETVKVVYHNDIIPEEFLPVFNSQAIEMFINNIKGLCDKFIYSNDDMYSNNYMHELDFFENDKLKLKYAKYNIKQWLHICYRNDYNAVFKNNELNLDDSQYLAFNHVDKPMIKLLNNDFINKNKELINKSITKFRDRRNLSQYVYHINALYNNMVIPECISNKYFNYNEITDIINQLDLNNPNRAQEICINDNDMFNEMYYQQILVKYQELYPNKSKYELQ